MRSRLYNYSKSIKIRRVQYANIICILVCCIFFNNNSYSSEEKDDKKTIIKYIERTYHDDLKLSPTELEQLSWAQNNDYSSNEMGILVKPGIIRIEVIRSLNGLYDLNLFVKGDKKAYKLFIKAQGNSPHKLAESSFIILSKIFKGLSKVEIEALRVATILRAVRKSPHQFKFVVDKHLNNTLFYENLLALSLRENHSIYPLAKEFCQQDINRVDLLKMQINYQMSFKQMLHADGGQNMFKNLRKLIIHNNFSHKDFDIWMCSWILNIAALYSHVDHKGSLYLNQQVFEDIINLRKILRAFIKNPAIDPVRAYLAYRAKKTGINCLKNHQKSLTLARIGALLKLHSTEDGNKLLEAYNELPATLQDEINNENNLQLTVDSMLSPIHVSVFFTNVYLYQKRNIKETLKICLPIYLNAILIYQDTINKGNLDEIPLSFNQLASEREIAKIVNLTNEKRKIDLQISKDGYVKINNNTIIKPNIKVHIVTKK